MILLDATMSADFATCPAKFYQRHRKDWALTGGTSIPATFGSAWGKGQDALWPEMCQPGAGNIGVALANAISAFRAYWAEAGLPETPAGLDEDILAAHKEMYWPKTAEEMYAGYLAKHSETLRTYTLLGVEKAFTVPISLDISFPKYGGLPDKVVKTKESHIIPIDHKSNSKYATAGGFRIDWQEQWTLAGQLIGYAYALSLIHNLPVPYAIVDASLVHKTHRNIHKMLSMTVSSRNMAAWLASEQRLVERINEADRTGVWEQQGIQSGACNGANGRFGCQFRDVCLNGYPLDSPKPPPGFELRPWTPITELAVSVEE